jgi:exonuclease SbcC
LNVEIVEKEERIKKLRELLNTQKLVEKSLGKEGIQAVIIENSIDYFENTARMYLRRFTHDQYDLKIETTVKNKKKDTVREEFDIVIDKGNGVWHPYESFSGSESLKIDLAVRVALSLTAAAFNSVKVRFLLIDEIAGSLDSVNRVHFPHMLRELAKDFDMILVITHWPEIQEEFSQTIVVQKTGYISKVINGDPPELLDVHETIEKEEMPKVKPMKRLRVDNDFFLAES